ncbi:MAG: hypothetical protein MZV70_30335 [Desulfobacterales bacterium]|nr:hypothetical protein [Desulfobacterales bacterium]
MLDDKEAMEKAQKIGDKIVRLVKTRPRLIEISIPSVVFFPVISVDINPDHTDTPAVSFSENSCDSAP